MTERNAFRYVTWWVVIILLSWWMMQVVHEAGHCIGAWATGGKVVRIDLHPLRISHTFVDPNPRPLVVVWSGPLGGCLIPLLLWAIVRRRFVSVEKVMRFFVGFCFVANGVYIGVGFVDPVGDAHDLIRFGIAHWQLGLFGLFTVPIGLWFWHTLSADPQRT